MAIVHIVLSNTSGATLPAVSSVPLEAETITSDDASQVSQTIASTAADRSWSITSTGNVWVAFGSMPVAVEGTGHLVLAGETRNFSVTAVGERVSVRDAVAQTPIPITLTNTVAFDGETYTLETPMRVGYALNGQPFIISDRAGKWTVSSTPSSLYGSYTVDGAMFDPRLIGDFVQGFNESWESLSGSQISAAMPYGDNIEPAAAGPFEITEGMCGRIVHIITDREVAPAEPDGETWTYVKKNIVLNVVPTAPPAGAICPIYDGAGGVEWVTTATASKDIFRGTGYAIGQTTLTTAVAGDYLESPNQPLYIDNGEQRRILMNNPAGGYSEKFGTAWAQLINACHALGADGVSDNVFFRMLTVGAQVIENSRRGHYMPGGAGQNSGQWMMGMMLAMATKDSRIESECHAYKTNELDQQFWVTNDWVAQPTGWADDIGFGTVGNNHDYNRQIYRPENVGTVGFKVTNSTDSPDDDWRSHDSQPFTDYQAVSGKVGVHCFAAMLGFINGPDGKDGSEFILNSLPNDTTNDRAASLAYWGEYPYLSNDFASGGNYGWLPEGRNVLIKRLAEAAVQPIPQPAFAFTPGQGHLSYVTNNASSISWNYSTASVSPLPITQFDNRLSLDYGRTAMEMLNCGVSGTTAPLPAGIPIYLSNRFHNSAGTRGWGSNDRHQVGKPYVFVQQATGTPSGTPTPDVTVPPKIVQRKYPVWKGREWKEADAIVAAGTTLYPGLGWFTSGNLTAGGEARFYVEGVVVHTVAIDAVDNTDGYTVQPGDAGIMLEIEIGGVTVDASNVVNDVPLSITSPAASSNPENVTLAHMLTATRSVTWTIRTAAQNAASVDHTQFEISGNTLRWIGNGTKNYEAPADAGSNNTYIVVVRATNAFTGAASDQTVTVTVTDVVEGNETNYDFTGSGTGLSLVPGWTLRSADERLAIGTNFLRRLGTATFAHFYSEGVNTSVTQRAGFTFGATGTQTPHIVLFGTWSGGLFNGYALYANSTTSLAIRKYVAGAGSTLGTVPVPASAAAFEFEAHVTGSATELKVYAGGGGVQQGSTITDSSGTRFVSGYNGLYLEGNVSSSSNVGDDFRGNMQF